eukprot:CFRG3179T1
MRKREYVYEGNDGVLEIEIFAAQSQQLKWYITLVVYVGVFLLFAPIYFSLDVQTNDNTRNLPLSLALACVTVILILVELGIYLRIRNATCVLVRGRWFYVCFFTAQFFSGVVFILSMAWVSGVVTDDTSSTILGTVIDFGDREISVLLFIFWLLRKLLLFMLLILVTGRLRYVVALYVNSKRLIDSHSWKDYYATAVIFFPAVYLDAMIEVYVTFILKYYDGYILQYSSPSVIYLYVTIVVSVQLSSTRDWRHRILDWGANLRFAIISLVIFLIWVFILIQQPRSFKFDFLIAGMGQYNVLVYGMDILLGQYVYCRRAIAETGQLPIYDRVNMPLQPETNTGTRLLSMPGPKSRRDRQPTSNKDWLTKLNEIQSMALYQLNTDDQL